MRTLGDSAAVITALGVFAATIDGCIEFVVRRAVAAQYNVEFVARSFVPCSAVAAAGHWPEGLHPVGFGARRR
jgi:hypothetical protein